MATNWTETAFSIEEKIKQGQADQARKSLAPILPRRIPRELAATFAALSRRAGLAAFSLRILNPIVRPGRALRVPATIAERAQYAASLTQVGATEEALLILRELDAADHPEVIFFQVLALITYWDYAATVPLLLTYLQSPKVDDYQKLVARINLAQAYVFLRQTEKAREALVPILDETRARGLTFARGTALELAAQNAVFSRRWADTAQYLKLAEDTAQSSLPLQKLHIRKWKTIGDLLGNGPARRTLRELNSVRSEARNARAWEVLRDCDRFEAQSTGNADLYHRVYFGTPFPRYRARLEEDFPKWTLPASYVWRLGGEGKGARTIDIALGRAGGKSDELKPGQTLHRLLGAFFRDFYRPCRVATLHQLVYPGEYFNPTSSPARVHRCLARLREWFTQCRLPIEIEEKGELYGLQARAPLQAIVRREAAAELTKEQAILHRLETFRPPRQEFTIAELAQFLGVSLRTAYRVVAIAIERGTITRFSAGPQARYRKV